jgi:hypothetical protein
MNIYEVTGVGGKTGKRRRRRYVCWDEAEARAKAGADGTLVESVSLVGRELATESQRAYADGIGASYPQDISMVEMSEILTMHEEHDQLASDRHRSFAMFYGIRCSQFTGKRLLFDRIFSALAKTGRDHDLIAWFAFRVYRDIVHGAMGLTVDHPNHPVFIEIGNQFESDPQVLKSIRHYGKGRALIWFGEWTDPSGFTHTGSSKNTIAYKKVSSVLRSHPLLVGSIRAAQAKRTVPALPSQSRESSSSGCLISVMLAIVGFVIIAFAGIHGLRLLVIGPVGELHHPAVLSDMRIDGGLFSDDWFPILVKQMDKVGRPDIDGFEAVMMREGKGGRQKGFFVSFGYTHDAEQECAAFYKRTGRLIKLFTVQEILDDQHVQKM